MSRQSSAAGEKRYRKMSHNENDSRSGRTHSVKMTPKVGIPLSDRKLPKAFKMNMLCDQNLPPLQAPKRPGR
jgi:hypothetical protein